MLIRIRKIATSSRDGWLTVSTPTSVTKKQHNKKINNNNDNYRKNNEKYKRNIFISNRCKK